jgi:tetratricopeptide (TPR) repeat protein
MRHFITGMLLLTLGALAVPQVTHAQLPEKPENFQVLPEDITVRELVKLMRGFAGGLGVRCIYCHVGDDPNDLSTTEFASDTKPTKRKAREMLRMVQHINNQLLPNVPDRSDPPVEVTCATCHHGVTKPVSLQSILTAKAKEDGVDAAIDEYQEMREEYYWSYSYDFRDFVLANVAENISGENLASAIQLLEFNMELFPESVNALFTMAQTHRRAGDNAGAIRTLERALVLDPENSFFKMAIEQLRGN